MPHTPIGKAQLSAQATHPPPFKPPPACADEFEHANYNFQVMLKHESGAPFETTLYMFKLMLPRLKSTRIKDCVIPQHSHRTRALIGWLFGNMQFIAFGVATWSHDLNGNKFHISPQLELGLPSPFKQTASAIFQQLPLQEHIELIAGIYAITHLPFETVSRFRAFWGRNASPYPKQMRQLIDFRDNIQKVLAQRKSAKVVQSQAVQDNIRAVRENHIETQQALQVAKNSKR
ncbi:hypothetical protein B0H16DRAFT_1467357, partial [Mycena metata]